MLALHLNPLVHKASPNAVLLRLMTVSDDGTASAVMSPGLWAVCCPAERSTHGWTASVNEAEENRSAREGPLCDGVVSLQSVAGLPFVLAQT